jgi:3-hydroxyisobutyrate dehydrogenase-like beta-hydroxyacid dehydrogenase
MNIGFVGLGRMGTGMVRRLLSAGHAVTVYNRTAAKAQPLAAEGASVAASVADASRGDAVVTMLADDAVVEHAVFDPAGVVGHLREGAVHISSSTISVSLAQRLAAAHAAVGQHFVSAPVFGRPDAAAAGRLFVVAAGPPAAVTLATPVFEAIGKSTFVVSDRADAANVVKLCGNFMIACAIEMLGEAIALAAKSGVDQSTFVDVMTSTLFDAPVFKTYGALIANRRFEPAGFEAPLGLKDVRLALAAGEEARVPMPFASVLRDRFLALLAHGGDRLDWSAIGRLPAVDAGAADH